MSAFPINDCFADHIDLEEIALIEQFLDEYLVADNLSPLWGGDPVQQSPPPSPIPEDIEVIALDGAEKLIVQAQPKVQQAIEVIELEGDSDDPAVHSHPQTPKDIGVIVLDGDEESNPQLQFQPMEVDQDEDGEVLFVGYFDQNKDAYIHIPGFPPSPELDKGNSNTRIANPSNDVATVVTDGQDTDEYLADDSDTSTTAIVGLTKRRVFKRRIAGSKDRSTYVVTPARPAKIPKLKELKPASTLFVNHSTRPHFSGAGMYGKNLLSLPGYKELLQKENENKRQAIQRQRAEQETRVTRHSLRLNSSTSGDKPIFNESGATMNADEERNR